MPGPSAPRVIGLGVATGLGYGKAALREGLEQGRDVFGLLRRPGREAAEGAPPFIGVELAPPPALPHRLPPRILRTTSLSGQLAVTVLDEAWAEAGLDAVDPERIGLIIGGSNTQTRHLAEMREGAQESLSFLRPQYGLSFFDTDLCGLCSAAFGVRGFAYTVGGASASGALAVALAAQALQAGQVDVCIAIGALQDLSRHELQAFSAMGAMASQGAWERPGQAARPFDRDRGGFVYGEMSAAIVLSREDAPLPRPDGPDYGRLLGWAQTADASRGPSPSVEGELRAVRGALAAAGLRPEDIDAISTHGTGSPLGDDTELATLRAAGLEGAELNAPKSIIGHGLSAAGAVELAALLLQLEDGRLHGTRNLDHPTRPELRWAQGTAPASPPRRALKLSMGFGGINLALVVEAAEGHRPPRG